jgi:LuxR family maltose regulon positive regulatory protein
MSRGSMPEATCSGGAVPSQPESSLAARYVIPPRPNGLVVRPRLLKLLRLGAKGRLTLVSAPAGTGKTVLVSSWAADERHPVTWISLEDHDSASVWSLIVEGLGHSGVDVPRGTPAAGTGDGNSFLAEMAAGIVASGQVTLILDCDGSLPAELASGLDYVLRNSDDHLHLVLLGRADPLFPLHKYRLAKTVVEIRLADLAFTNAEARALMAALGVELSPSLAADVTSRTQGWAAGLRFAAMTLTHRVDLEAAIRDLHGDTGTVAEYLLAEVLNAQPEGARELLLRTSIVDVMQPGLVEILAGPQARRALAFLVQGNAFIEETPGTPGRYTYHPLFRELLRAQLGFEAPGTIPELHRAAAQWMAVHGQLEDAVHHSLAAGDWEEAAGYVVDDLAIVQLLVQRAPCRLRDMLMHLPADAVGLSTSLVRAALAMADFDVEGCARHVADARQLLNQGGTARRTAIDLAFSVLVLARTRDVHDGSTVLEAAEEAERLIRVQPPERVAAHPELPAMVLSRKGRALLTRGRLDEATAAFASGSQMDEWPGREYPVLTCLGHRALMAALNGQLRKAESLGEQAVRLQAEAGIPRIWCPAAPEVALAWVHIETYDLAGARRHAALAAESVDIDPLPRAMLTLVSARLSRARGDVAGALSGLEDALTRVAELPAWLQDSLHAEEAGLDIVNGEPARAKHVAEELIEPASPAAALVLAQARLANGDDVGTPLTTLSSRTAPLATRVGAWLLEASQQLGRGQEHQATVALERSLRLAAPERLRRPFREASPEMRRFLRRQGYVAMRHSWLGDGQDVPSAHQPTVPRQLARSRPLEGVAPRALMEPLTEREREVLEHLSELLTTEEIAGVMFVSVNTVRTHVRNILRKLAASRRNEAVRRARELNLLRH